MMWGHLKSGLVEAATEGYGTVRIRCGDKQFSGMKFKRSWLMRKSLEKADSHSKNWQLEDRVRI